MTEHETKALDLLNGRNIPPHVKAGISLRTLLFNFNPCRSEFIFGTILAFWGLWLFLPFWETPQDSSVYHILLLYAPRFLWGLFAICLGIGQMMAVLWGHFIWRRLFGFWTMLFWTFLLYVVGVENHALTVVPMFFSLALWSALNYLNMREADALAMRRNY